MGDIKPASFVEAMRQIQFCVSYANFVVSLVPDIHGKQNTKPTQTTAHLLRGLGLLPDLMLRVYLSIKALEHSAFRVHQKLTISVRHSRTCFFHRHISLDLNDP